jgi:NAD(P)-dependent dehydrogenase (short-subunit alcohol dehydrogenase family)
MSKVLKDKIAVVTGASRGIGSAVAKRYAQEGAHVILVARTISGLEAVDDEIKAVGGESTLVPCDIRDFDKIDQLGGVIAERFGLVDILLGNAGAFGHLSPMTHIPPEEWQRVIDINLTSNYRLLRSFEPLLKASEAGRALFVTSGVAKGVPANWGSYAVSKAALEHMVRIYAEEMKNSPICVNLIDPGVVKTKMLDQALPGGTGEGVLSPDEVTELFVKMVRADYSKTGCTEKV